MNIKSAIPVILTITGCISTVGAVVLSAIETPGAIERIDTHRLEIDPSGESDLCWQEKTIDYVKSYPKTIACTAVAMASIICSCVAGSSNYRALLKSSTAIAAGSTAYISKYRNKVKKMIGEEKEKLLNKQVCDEIKSDDFSDTVVFHFDLPRDENGFEMYEPIEFKSSLKMMYEYYIDAMLKIANGEVMSIREVFPQIGNAIPKNDPRQCQLDRIWHQDLLYDGFDVALPTITFEPVNHKGSENDEDKNPLVNNGNPAYVIHYLEDPEPPEYLMTADC